MIYPSADKIEEQVKSKYALVILAAKRAKQVKEGSRLYIDTDSRNPLTVALEEIAAGEIQYKFDEDSLAGREARADQEAVVGARNLDVDLTQALPDADAEIARAAEMLGAGLDELLDDEHEGDEVEEEEEEEVAPADDETDASEI